MAPIAPLLLGPVLTSGGGGDPKIPGKKPGPQVPWGITWALNSGPGLERTCGEGPHTWRVGPVSAHGRPRRVSRLQGQRGRLTGGRLGPLRYKNPVGIPHCVRATKKLSGDRGIGTGPDLAGKLGRARQLFMPAGIRGGPGAALSDPAFFHTRHERESCWPPFGQQKRAHEWELIGLSG